MQVPGLFRKGYMLNNFVFEQQHFEKWALQITHYAENGHTLQLIFSSLQKLKKNKSRVLRPRAIQRYTSRCNRTKKHVSRFCKKILDTHTSTQTRAASSPGSVRDSNAPCQPPSKTRLRRCKCRFPGEFARSTNWLI